MGDLAVLAQASRGASGQGSSDRRDWWLIDRKGQVRNLTATVKAAPAVLLPETGSASFVGVSEGDVYRFHPDGAAPQNLTQRFQPPITSIVWPFIAEGDVSASKVVFSVQRGEGTELHLLDLSSSLVTALSKPTPTATLADFATDGTAAAFSANEADGTSIWLTSGESSHPNRVLSVNGFLREIQEGELKQIEYQSLDGQRLKAWIILPFGYREGTAYPLVAWVYAGSVMRDTPPRLTRLNVSHSLNLQLLAAQGYAVLLPSMPLPPETVASDPYLEMTKGVLPAVDRAVSMGIADPNRLGVMGQSYGGYSTYSLITQTKRFKAAVVLAGIADLVAQYGQLDARYRRDPYGHELYYRMSLFETGQARMANPPWKDLGRYLRNSPLHYVERVETPVMIIQGDMDYVGIQQGEQFFTALHRQNKRAAFVRYWGEGHVLEAPANVRDMWQRIYGWFDEFLGPGAKSDDKRHERGR